MFRHRFDLPDLAWDATWADRDAWAKAYNDAEQAAFDAATAADRATLLRTLDHLLNLVDGHANNELVLNVPVELAGSVDRFIAEGLMTPTDEWADMYRYRDAYVQDSGHLPEGRTSVFLYVDDQKVLATSWVIPGTLPQGSVDLYCTLRDDGADEVTALSLCQVVDGPA